MEVEVSEAVQPGRHSLPADLHFSTDETRFGLLVRRLPLSPRGCLVSYTWLCTGKRCIVSQSVPRVISFYEINNLIYIYFPRVALAIS